MADRPVKHSTAKGGASATDMAARPFQCEWHEGCAKSFNRKSDLQRHYRIHTNERPYACDYSPCNKTFIQRSALTVHRRTHTGDKPHKCPFIGCGKCFSDSSSLARHRRIHTNDKPYICRNQRCKKAFCRKTTMTKHIRKEHPNESTQEDQDAEYSDVELSDDDGLDDDSDEIKDEPQDLYREPMDATELHLTRRASEYNRNLWALPGQSTHRPGPLNLDGMAISRSESRIQEIKLERHSSTTPRRSFTEPFPDSDMEMDMSEYSLSRADTMPSSLAISAAMPQSHTNVSMAPQFQLRNHDPTGLWSPRHGLQDSPTSLTHSSPSSESAQSHPMFTSQPYQLQAVDLPSHEQMQYPTHHGLLVSSTLQQPLNDLTVHEIHLDDENQQQPFTDVASTNQTPLLAGIQQHASQQDQFMAMSREASQNNMYDGPTPQSAMQHYRDSMLATSAPKYQLSRSNTSIQDPSYRQSQYLTALGSLSTSNQAFPPNNAMFQYNHATTDWWKDTELEEKGWILPNQRVPEFDQWGS